MAKKWVCTVCGYVHEGPEPPAQCPMCKVPASKFKEVAADSTTGLTFVDEHKIGVAQGCDAEVWKGLQDHFHGECTEVGMYLAMSRQADREGYPEVAEAFKRYAWEEAEHASKFCELIGEMVWDTKTNLKKRMEAEAGACEAKKLLLQGLNSSTTTQSTTQYTRCARTKHATAKASKVFTRDFSVTNRNYYSTRPVALFH